MYSLVLMAALSGGADAPGTWFSHGCGGCYGCCGGCYGCCGGWSYGCCGGWSCGGWCHGCCGGCCGGWVYSAPVYSCSGCCGCCGGYGYGVPYVVVPATAARPVAQPVASTPAKPAAAAKTTSETKPTVDLSKAGTETKPTVDASANRARIVVEVPADARLYIDSHLTRATESATRTLLTPPLQPGEDYFYILRAEGVRDGKPVTESKQIIVRAGGDYATSFRSMGAATPNTTAAAAGQR